MPLLAASQAASAGLRAVPGDAGLPIINHNLEVLNGSWMTDLSRWEKYGDLAWGKAMGVRIISAIGPEATAAVLTNKDNAAGMASMTSTFEYKGSDVALMHWVQFDGTPKKVSGTDVWIIRNGKVVSQTVLVDPAPAKK
jgi:hypothetical protein